MKLSWAIVLGLFAASVRHASAACDASCHCDYYDTCVACKTGTVVNWDGNSGSGACVANAAACPSTVAFMNGYSFGQLTCVPSDAKVTDCAAYVAYYNGADGVFCGKCSGTKALWYDEDNDWDISCVTPATGCPIPDWDSITTTGKTFTYYDQYIQNTTTVCVYEDSYMPGCSTYYYDYMEWEPYCLNCTSPAYAIDYYNWMCVHPMGCPADDYWNGNRTYSAISAPPGSSRFCQWPSDVQYGCTVVNEFGYCVNCVNGFVSDGYYDGYCNMCSNCVLNLYTYIEMDIYKLPFECARFTTVDNYVLDSKFTEGLKLAILTAYTTAAKALKTKKNAAVSVFPAAIVPVFAFWPENDGEGWRYTWNKGLPEYAYISCYTVTDPLTSTKYNDLYLEVEIDTYITLSPTVNTRDLNAVRNEWFDALVDLQQGQFSVQAFSMWKSIKLAVDTYLGTLGTYAKEADRPFVEMYWDAFSYPSESTMDDTYPFYGWFDETDAGY